VAFLRPLATQPQKEGFENFGGLRARRQQQHSQRSSSEQPPTSAGVGAPRRRHVLRDAMLVAFMLQLVAITGSHDHPFSSIGAANAKRWDPQLAFEAEGDLPSPPEGWEAPEVTQTSSERAKRIAKRLNRLGTVMYGAYWCPHCNDQKRMFGKEALQNIRYVECASDGKDSAAKTGACAAVKGYPTWEIDGFQFSGERDFDEFEQILDLIEKTRPKDAEPGWTARYVAQRSAQRAAQS